MSIFNQNLSFLFQVKFLPFLNIGKTTENFPVFHGSATEDLGYTLIAEGNPNAVLRFLNFQPNVIFFHIFKFLMQSYISQFFNFSSFHHQTILNFHHLTLKILSLIKYEKLETVSELHMLSH